MKRLRMVLQFAAVALVFCRPNFAATEYVIVNDGNTISNSAILYKLSTRTSKLAKTAVLKTGGQGQAGFPNFSQVEEAVTPNAGCIFVFDDGSSDLAAFSKASGYKRAGKYFNQNLIAGENGGTLATTPDGRFLYTYSSTGNIGVWAVNSDCTLTLGATYSDDGADGYIKVAPNGKYLVVSGLEDATFLYAINQTDGTLTNLGSVGFNVGVCARLRFGCFAYTPDITKDSKFVVFASAAPNITRQYGLPVALTARITSSGFVNPHAWVLTKSKGWDTNFFPFLSAAGYAGSGDVYFGSWGGGYNLGVLTVTFTEHPMSFKFKNATLVSAPEDLDGNIAVTGNLMVIAQYPSQIGVFRIKKDGSLKLLTTTTVGEQGGGMFSLSIFPNTR